MRFFLFIVRLKSENVLTNTIQHTNVNYNVITFQRFSVVKNINCMIDGFLFSFGILWNLCRNSSPPYFLLWWLSPQQCWPKWVLYLNRLGTKLDSWRLYCGCMLGTGWSWQIIYDIKLRRIFLICTGLLSFVRQFSLLCPQDIQIETPAMIKSI